MLAVLLRRGPISFKKWGKEDQRGRGSPPLDSLSLVGETLPGRGNFFAWPEALCRNAVRKRAHRLRAPSSGWVAAAKGSPGEGSCRRRRLRGAPLGKFTRER